MKLINWITRIGLMFFILGIFNYGNVNAQSVLHLTDGSKVEVLIESMIDNEIQFKKFNSSDLTIYSIDRNKVDRVEFRAEIDTEEVVKWDNHVDLVVSDIENDTEYVYADEMKYSFWRGGFNLHHPNGLRTKLKKKDVLNLAYNTPAYADLSKHYKFRNINLAIGFSGLGVILIGGTVGILGAIEYDDDLILVGNILTGGGVIVGLIGVPFGIISLSKAYTGAAKYNDYMNPRNRNVTLNFGTTNNGIGMVLKF